MVIDTDERREVYTGCTLDAKLRVVLMKSVIDVVDTVFRSRRSSRRSLKTLCFACLDYEKLFQRYLLTCRVKDKLIPKTVRNKLILSAVRYYYCTLL